MNFEIWLPADYPGYEVSNLGRIRNALTGRIKTPSPIRKKQYLSVNLQQGGRQNKQVRYVHELVATAFYGERPIGEDGKPMVIDHRDSNKFNNRIDNLEYITQAENVRRAIEFRKRQAIAARQFEQAAARAIAV